MKFLHSKGFTKNLIIVVLIISLGANVYFFRENSRLNYFYADVKADTVREISYIGRLAGESIDKALVSNNTDNILEHLEQAMKEINRIYPNFNSTIRNIYGNIFPMSQEPYIMTNGLWSVISAVRETGEIDEFNEDYLITLSNNLNTIQTEFRQIAIEDIPNVRVMRNIVLDKNRSRKLEQAFNLNLEPLPQRPRGEVQLTPEEQKRIKEWEEYSANAEEYHERAIDVAHEFWEGKIKREDIWHSGGGPTDITVSTRTTLRGKATDLQLRISIWTMDVTAQHMHISDPSHISSRLEIKEPHNLSIEEGETVARDFLKARFGYEDLDLSTSETWDGIHQHLQNTLPIL